MEVWYVFVFSASILTGSTYGYSNGAGLSACRTLVPRHDGLVITSNDLTSNKVHKSATLNKDDPGFTLEFSQINDGFNVSIVAPSDRIIKGFMIASDNGDGFFTAGARQKAMNCGRFSLSAITHDEILNVQRINTKWSANGSQTGKNVKFSATVVYDKTTAEHRTDSFIL